MKRIRSPKRWCERYRSAGIPDRVPPPDEPARVQGGRAAGRLEVGNRRIRRGFRRRFHPARRISWRAPSTTSPIPKVGVVQTRWTYLNRHYNLLTEVEAMLLDGHFVLEHGARFGGGLFFNFNGTAGILRRSMIEDAGGWQHDTLTEDSDLSYRAQLKGWKFVYMPGVECPSELPVEMHGFQVQQSRWAKGLTQVAIKLLPSILQADLPRRVKAGGVLPSDAEHLLSADDCGLRADAAGDDRALLHGLAADAVASICR